MSLRLSGKQKASSLDASTIVLKSWVDKTCTARFAGIKFEEISCRTVLIGLGYFHGPGKQDDKDRLAWGWVPRMLTTDQSGLDSIPWSSARAAFQDSRYYDPRPDFSRSFTLAHLEPTISTCDWAISLSTHRLEIGTVRFQ